ncbi:MAG: tRNA(Met) cytidine acetyltransferase [Ketobacter sp.]|nr:tRNA(Met) cytidine acetyltransferase [Ketobacter sp.]
MKSVILGLEIRQQLAAIFAEMARAGQRMPVLVEGDEGWTLQAAQAVLSIFGSSSVLWYSERAPKGSWQLPANKVNHELGREAEAAVFDLYSGFAPDAMAAIAGAIKVGGVLLILGPPLESWAHFQDALASRIAVEPWGVSMVKRDFIQRAAWILDAFPHKIRLCQEGPWEGIDINAPTKESASEDDWGCITACQRRAVEAVMHVVSGHRKRPLVLEADRGRGKSAAMGLAVARLMAQGKSIVVTAPRPDCVETLIKFAERTTNQVGGALQYFAPDHLLQTQPSADLLLVDEAAAIAPELLKAMLRTYSRVAFATTVNGYEGTGRGFAIRFQRHLDVHYPGWSKCSLTQPVRWLPGDWLEGCLNKLLLLKPAQQRSQSDQADPVEFDEFCFRCDDRSEHQLNSVFELLVSAHYRTRPSDLRTLLDGSNIRLFVLRQNQSIKAVAMVAQEGQLSGDLAESILAGKRRPHGQVLSQTLAVHLGQDVALAQHHWRIVRIAVQPDEQRQGLGTSLVQHLIERAEKEGVDNIGSLFSGDHQVLRFWQKMGFSVLRVGYTRESTTGSYSLLVAKGCSEHGELVIDASSQRFREDFPLTLKNIHSQLPVDLVWQILSGSFMSIAMTGMNYYERDQRSLEQYVTGSTPYENVAAGLWRLVWYSYSRAESVERLDERARTIIVMKVLQNSTWEDCVARLNLAGKKQAHSELRQSIQQWMQLSGQLSG